MKTMAIGILSVFSALFKFPSRQLTPVKKNKNVQLDIRSLRVWYATMIFLFILLACNMEKSKMFNRLMHTVLISTYHARIHFYN